KAFPGVVSVATTSRAPYATNDILPIGVRAQGGRLDGTTAPVQMLALIVSPEYFATLKIPVLSGRAFGPDDRTTSPHVVLGNEPLARLAFGTPDAIGRTIDWWDHMGQFTLPRTIIGVTRDVRELGGTGGVVPTAYESSVQSAQGSTVLIRTTGDPALVAREATRLVHESDPKRPVTDVRTLESAAQEMIAPSRLNATLFSSFALLALAIAAVGIGGVLAFSVSQRTKEFGIRMALGSGRGEILRGVLVDGLALAAFGL